MSSNLQLYQELGCLFYALACESADGSLLLSDKERVEEIILFNWVTFENNDRFNTDNAYRILFQFGNLDEVFTTADDAFDSFEKYYCTHKEQFDATLRNKIFTSAARIAQEIGEAHHQLSTHLSKLQSLLGIGVN